jgi:hypothetical protein
MLVWWLSDIALITCTVLLFGWSTALLVALVGRTTSDTAAGAGGQSLHHAWD